MSSGALDEVLAEAIRAMEFVPMLLGIRRLRDVPGRTRVARLLFFKIGAMRRVVITCSCIHDGEPFAVAAPSWADSQVLGSRPLSWISSGLEWLRACAMREGEGILQCRAE